MKKYILIVAVLVLVILSVLIFKTKKEQPVSVEPVDQVTHEEQTIFPTVYTNSSLTVSVNLPDGYVADESYAYEGFGTQKKIQGIKFTVPTKLADETNLSNDSYISVEQLPNEKECTTGDFFSLSNGKPQTVTDAGVTYSMEHSSDAGAGNRYEETVYVISGAKTCVAIRYFIHYSVFENYPAGTIKEFDLKALTAEFDQIRRSIQIK